MNRKPTRKGPGYARLSTAVLQSTAGKIPELIALSMWEYFPGCVTQELVQAPE